jgi:hypothetical protein
MRKASPSLPSWQNESEDVNVKTRERRKQHQCPLSSPRASLPQPIYPPVVGVGYIEANPIFCLIFSKFCTGYLPPHFGNVRRCGNLRSLLKLNHKLSYFDIMLHLLLEKFVSCLRSEEVCVSSQHSS